MATYLLKSRSTTHMMMNMRPRPTSTPIMVGSANAPMPRLSVPATHDRNCLKKLAKSSGRHQTELDACKRDAVRIGRKEDGAVCRHTKRNKRHPSIHFKVRSLSTPRPKPQTKSSLSTSSALNHSSTDEMSTDTATFAAFGQAQRRQMTVTRSKLNKSTRRRQLNLHTASRVDKSTLAPSRARRQFSAVCSPTIRRMPSESKDF
jgi:hypothetical protein